ncbi:MAG: ABC transporter permease [Planctomycetaceae bacterium]
MSFSQLLLRTVGYYWRTNLAVLLGVVAGTAVIGGALVVGDSVRGSLRRISLDRLGEIDHVLESPRFFREQLADDMQRDPAFQQRFAAVAPALVMQGSLTRQSSGNTTRAGKVHIYGVDGRWWNLTHHDDLAPPAGDEVILNSRTAAQLGVSDGDAVSLFVELPGSIPRDSLLGNRDEVSREIALTVKAVLGADVKVGGLSLRPNQQMPLNAFVALDTLQRNLDLAATAGSPRQRREAAAARVNTMFVNAIEAADRSGGSSRNASEGLTSLVATKLQLEDVGLRLVKKRPQPGAETYDYLSLESQQQILDDSLADVARQAAESLGLKHAPILVYLANEIANAQRPEKFSMYSVIAGVDLRTLIPPAHNGTPPVPLIELGSDGIILTDWLEKDLDVKQGDQVTVKYHVVGSHGELPEETRTFTVREFVKVGDNPIIDRGLTPEVKGITDAEAFADWDQPFEMKMQRITGRDEEYWEKYRATPKALVSLDAAQQLWSSKYGRLTSLRVFKAPGKSLDESAEQFQEQLLATLLPEHTGLVFEPVKHNALEAASGTTPFSVLFISFSFFLILSATILIGLLFRLGIERRAASIGLLSAVGFTPRGIRRLFLAEALLVVFLGGVLGVAAAIGYASLIVYGLKTWWIGAIGTQELDVYVTPTSLATGFLIAIAAAMAVAWWALRQLRSISPRALLSGVTEHELGAAQTERRGKRAGKVGIGALIVALVSLAAVLSGLAPADREAFPGVSWSVALFFVVGIALLTSGLAFFAGWLDSDRSAAVRGSGFVGVARLGIRNASRHRQRSVATVALMASATFVIVAVAAARRNPAVETPDKSSGNGGFTLVAETSTPILFDLNTSAGRNKLNLRVESSATGDAAERAGLLKTMNVMPFRVRPGDDSSCLNIYQTRVPRILGVPQRMIQRGGFKFVGAKSSNPWTLLNERLDDAVVDGKSIPVYPVLGDMNTLQYSLHKGVGETIRVPDEVNPQCLLRIVGMFDGSVFQGVLLVSEENFRTAFPQQRAGYEYFLIETEPDAGDELSKLLETGLTEYGFDAERVSQRLAEFLAVQNTYLLTFQTLGALGLLLGTFGLATVMLRNVLERRAELALFRAVGFRNSSLAWLVLLENAFLLFWGLTAGTVSALLAMVPHLTSTGADVPWYSGSLMLVAVFAMGMLAALLAVAEAVRTPILATLRSD